MHKKPDNEQLTELNLDHVYLAKKLGQKKNILKTLGLKTKLLMLSQGRDFLKYLSLIICFIIVMVNNDILIKTNTDSNKLTQLVMIGLIFSVIWIVTSKNR